MGDLYLQRRDTGLRSFEEVSHTGLLVCLQWNRSVKQKEKCSSIGYGSISEPVSKRFEVLNKTKTHVSYHPFPSHNATVLRHRGIHMM